MLEVKVSSRTTKWIEVYPDDKTNEGGFYCEIYDDPLAQKGNCEDVFTIDKRNISPTIKDKNERRAKALAYARNRVLERYKR